MLAMLRSRLFVDSNEDCRKHPKNIVTNSDKTLSPFYRKNKVAIANPMLAMLHF